PGLAAMRELTAQSLGRDLLWIRGAGANLLALKDEAGLVFIDGGLKSVSAVVLNLALHQLGASKAHTILNTHWHAEHTGLNETLGRDGAKIISHEQTRLWLTPKVRYHPDEAPILPLPKKAQPNPTT